jgi:hypothetical protein
MPQYLIIVGSAWRRIIKPLQNRSEFDGLASKVRYIRLKMKIFLVKWGQVLFFASQLLTYSNKSKKEGIERKLLELA